jgi:hypothetical protein
LVADQQRFSYSVVRNKPFPIGYTTLLGGWSGNLDHVNGIVVQNTSDGSVAGSYQGPAIALDAANDVLYVTYDTTGFAGAGPVLLLPSASTRSAGTADGQQLFNSLYSFPSRLHVAGGKLYALGYEQLYQTTCPLSDGPAPPPP